MMLSKQMLARKFKCNVCKKRNGTVYTENPLQEFSSKSSKIPQTSKSPNDIKSKSNTKQFRVGQCSSCGKNIHPGRLKANPGTKLCIDCAETSISGSKNRTTKASGGSRADWSRDRGSWRRYVVVTRSRLESRLILCTPPDRCMQRGWGRWQDIFSS